MEVEQAGSGAETTRSSSKSSRPWSSGMWLPFASAVLGGVIAMQVSALMADGPNARHPSEVMGKAQQAHVHRLLEAVVLGEADLESRHRTLRYLVTAVELDDRTRNWALGELTGFSAPSRPAPAPAPVVEELPLVEEPSPAAAVARTVSQRVSVPAPLPVEERQPARAKKAPTKAPPPPPKTASRQEPKAAPPVASDSEPATTKAPPTLESTGTALTEPAPTQVGLAAPPPPEPTAPPEPEVAPEPPPPPPPPKIRYAASLVELDMSRVTDTEGVSEIMQDKVGSLTQCYEPAVVAGTDLAAGEIEVGFRISNGRVVRATPLFVGVDDEVVRCVVRQVRGWRFGRTSEGAVSAWFEFRRL